MSKQNMNEDLTFITWSDTHFGYQQRFYTQDIRFKTIEQINHLTGWPYPDQIGGCIGPIDFVMHCGDFVDGNAVTKGLVYYKYFKNFLNFPQYETLGNHEAGNDDTALKYFLEKYKSVSYSFDKKGIHFISLHAEYDAGEQASIPNSYVSFLKEDLEKVDDKTPVIFFSHASIPRTVNGDQLVALLKTKRVILCVSGHHHQPAVYQHEGLNCLNIGQCRDHPQDPEFSRSFGVVQIKNNTLTAIPWRWDLGDWELGQRMGIRSDEPCPHIADNRFIMKITF